MAMHPSEIKRMKEKAWLKRHKEEQEGLRNLSRGKHSQRCFDNGGVNCQCPGAKEEEKSSGCFLSTACVEFMGLPDDCDLLETLRKFRDEVVSTTEDGKEKISLYYYYSPALVTQIKIDKEQDQVFENIYNMINKAKKMIENDRYQDAITIYENEFYRLIQRYDIPMNLK